MSTLIVVDLQHDFIDGSLGTKEAQAILPAAAAKIRAHEGPIYVTRDTHPENYLSTREGRYLPVSHCTFGTWGWQVHEEIAAALEGKDVTYFDKPTFGSTALMERLLSEKPEKVELIGLCTDICVVSNALLIKAALPETDIAVDASCCAGVTPQKHEAALETMRSCQIDILGA